MVLSVENFGLDLAEGSHWALYGEQCREQDGEQRGSGGGLVESGGPWTSAGVWGLRGLGLGRSLLRGHDAGEGRCRQREQPLRRHRCWLRAVSPSGNGSRLGLTGVPEGITSTQKYCYLMDKNTAWCG